jgi:hypothetical protein
LRVVAGAHRDDAACAFVVGEARQLVAGASFLERRDELEVLELHDDRAAENIGQRLRHGAGCADDGAVDDAGGGVDVGE